MIIILKKPVIRVWLCNVSFHLFDFITIISSTSSIIVKLSMKLDLYRPIVEIRIQPSYCQWLEGEGRKLVPVRGTGGSIRHSISGNCLPSDQPASVSNPCCISEKVIKFRQVSQNYEFSPVHRVA
jgi:hypothetical protein